MAGALNKMYLIDLKTGEISIGICRRSAMIALNPEIKNVLIKIDYIKRYEELSNKFNAERTPSSNRLK
ncbi:MAG: hypothetical protein U0J42_10305 [[Bacteroides] pectinophilus]|jgi:hypothetical protein|nr:hypothetical protein [[Bacteroides] pectinophilus]